MQIEADYRIGAVLKNIHTSWEFRKGPFGWQQIEPDGSTTPFEYPIPCRDMQRMIQAGVMELPTPTTEAAHE